MSLQIGSVLAERYRILRVLGQGGMGAVYLATDESLGLPCAVKENLNLSPDSERLFRREATLLASLRHRHLPRVTNHFVLDNQQYLVMDYVEGEDLKQRFERQGPLPEPLVRQWAEQLCDALAYLHGLNPPVIHRDIKPANIKLTPSGEVMLVDFGVARPTTTAPDHHTATNTLAFTPGFTPPEQYGLGRTDARADQYALAATLYNLLTGQAPPDSVERLLGNVALIAPNALRPELSPGLVAALTRALAVQPEDRFASVTAFRAALSAPAPAAPAAPTPKFDPTETVVRRPAGPVTPPPTMLQPAGADQTMVRPPAPAASPLVPPGATVIQPPLPAAPSSPPQVPEGATLLKPLTPTPAPTGQAAAPPATLFEPGGFGALPPSAPQPTLFEPGGGLAGSAPPPVVSPPPYGGAPTGAMAAPVPAAPPPAAPPAKRARPRWLLPVALGCGFVVLAGAALAGGSALGLYFTNRNTTPTVAVATVAPATETVPVVVAASDTAAPPTDTAAPEASATPQPEDTAAAPVDTDTPEPTLTVGPSETVAPAGPPPGGGTGRLAFISNRDGQFFQVYTMNADGSDVQQLTTDPTDKWNPSWAYNGTQLAWSPDGTQLIYVADGGSGNVLDLWVINADGTNPQNLTRNKGDDVQPTWCSDGTIWFASNRINGVPQIFGATLADLLAGVRPFNFSGTHNFPREFDPSPFPDCQRLVFTSTLDGAREIWRYFPDCPECYRKVATYKDQNGSAEQPALSPDGTLLAYTRVLADAREIIVVDPNDRTTAQQVTSSLKNYTPAWSPDGQWIAFNSDRDGNREVYIMQANGAGQVNLSQNIAADTDPVWQPAAP